jgi:hypothetical protein
LRIVFFEGRRTKDHGIATKANLTKVSDAKPRVLASYATFDATQDPKIAGLPQWESVVPGPLN